MQKRIKSFTAVSVVSSFGNKPYFQLQNYETENITMFIYKKDTYNEIGMGCHEPPHFSKNRGPRDLVSVVCPYRQ